MRLIAWAVRLVVADTGIIPAPPIWAASDLGSLQQPVAIAASVVARAIGPNPNAVQEPARAGLLLGAPAGRRFAAAITGRLAVLPQRWKAAVAAMLLAAVLVAVGWAFWSWAGREPELTITARPSLVVLPVKPLGDEADAALATLGEIAAGIWRAPRGFLPDIRPPSAAKGANEEPTAIGRRLRVRYVVRALARREKEHLHVTIQLIEAQAGRQIWAADIAYRPVERDAQSRAAAHRRNAGRRDSPGGGAAPAAGQHAGRAFRHVGPPAHDRRARCHVQRQAITYFEKALAADPQHVLALVHYARATAIHRLSGWMDGNEVEQRIAKAEAAIDLAIRRAPSAGGFVTRGSVMRAKGEHGLAIAAFRHALDLDANFFPARAELGRSLIDIGKPRKPSLCSRRRSRRTRPASPGSCGITGWDWRHCTCRADTKKRGCGWTTRSRRIRTMTLPIASRRWRLMRPVAATRRGLRSRHL